MLEGRPRGPRAQAVREAAARPERVRARLRKTPPAPQHARLQALTDRQSTSARVLRLLLLVHESAHSGEGHASNQPPHDTDERARAPPGHVTRRYRRAPRRPAATQLPVKACTGRLRVQLRQEVRSEAPEGRGTAGS